MENATYVFKNGKVITVNDNDDIVEAVAINGNKIVYVGENEGADKFISPDTKVIDLNGRALTPGFIDCHMHPILAGFFGGAIIDVTYPLCRSNAEMFDIIREAAKTTPKGQWIKVWGYDQNKYLEHTHPTIDELDAVAPDNPVQCMRICGHLGVYNTLALELGGIKSIEDAKRFPENQIVIKDGKLTGLTKDNTNFYLWNLITYTDEERWDASFEEDIKGSIEVGKLADFALLSEDILSYPQDKVQDIQIDMTMIDGEVVYERNGD